MTTGRINQITILIPGATSGEGTPRRPPEGGGALQGWGARRSAHPAARDGPRGRRSTPSNHSIAPTEFPRGRSAAQRLGLSTTTLGSIGPQEGGLQSPVSARRRIPTKALPPRPGRTVASSQPSTDPKEVPAGAGPAGLRFPEGRSNIPAVDELTRVDIDGRHPGEERACMGRRAFRAEAQLAGVSKPLQVGDREALAPERWGIGRRYSRAPKGVSSRYSWGDPRRGPRGGWILLTNCQRQSSTLSVGRPLDSVLLHYIPWDYR
jgi:hypothetical protein